MIDRMERLCSLLQEEIASFVMRERRPGAKAMVTITGVELSKSLEHATVFYSVLGSASDCADAQSELDSMRYQLVAALRKRVRMKRLPAIAFKHDPTPLRASRIEKIFSKLESERADTDE